MAAKLTDLQVRSAKPREKPYKLSAGRGLVLLVQPDGRRFWRLRYAYAGKEKMISLGAYPFVGLKEAEAKADQARLTLAAGEDPSEKRRQAKFALRLSASRTFADAAAKWMDHNRPRWRPATVEKVQQYLDKDLLPPLGRRPLANLTPLELGAVVERIEQRKAFNVAKKSRQWLNAIFEFAIAKGLASSNPAEHLGAVAEIAPPSQNHAHLTVDELPAFLRALEAYSGSPLTRGAIWLALWTANRPGVTRTLRWAELDLEDALWTIAPGREGMKRGYRHYTPLPRQAVAMLRELHQLTGTFEHVFIGRNNPREAMSEGAIASALKKMKYGGKQTAHGFRHLVSTALNELGYEPDWIERQLAHGDPDAIRDTYNKAHYLEPRREMMQAWADKLDKLKAGGEVVPLRKKSGASR
jgi:integrase